ncbi:MAG: polysaccharide biosynthesis/export family protein [Spirochaetota bacterium]|nr:polysaccharide biosynthesis/export family protein [Spirochaetota bacterium]
MNYHISFLLIILYPLTIFSIIGSAETNKGAVPYTVGIGDIIEIKISEPEESTDRVIVSPDGLITVPYIGSVRVEGWTIKQIKEYILKKLSDGYLNYPIISVYLIESRSRKFTISGQINKPGTYTLGEKTTVLKAISIAGGFTKFGSSSRVKVLRPRKGRPGYNTIKIDLKSVMNGNSDADIMVQPGDIIVVSSSLF